MWCDSLFGYPVLKLQVSYSGITLIQVHDSYRCKKCVRETKVPTPLKVIRVSII